LYRKHPETENHAADVPGVLEFGVCEAEQTSDGVIARNNAAIAE